MTRTVVSLWRALPVFARALISAFVVSLFADLASLGLFANLHYRPEIPWSFAATLILLATFWYLTTSGPWPAATRAWCKNVTRQGSVPGPVGRAAVPAVILSVVLLIVFRLLLPSILPVAPPEIKIDLSGSSTTVIFGLLMSVAAIAGVTEEIVFRGYLQKQLEDAYGITPAILLTGLMFWLAHADKVSVTHLPFHLLASVLFGALAYLTRSLWPAIFAHAAGDAIALPVYLFREPAFLWPALSARPVWEAAGASTLTEKTMAIWQALQPANLAGPSPHRTFAILSLAFFVLVPLTAGMFWRLATVAKRETKGRPPSL